MSKVKRLIKISGMLYVIFALMSFQYFNLYEGFCLGIGLGLLGMSFLSDEMLYDKKLYIILLAIISLWSNIILAIMLFVAYDELRVFRKDKLLLEQNITPESKRIDILLKIGLGMVLISGVLFATSSWQIIPDNIKCLGLLMFGGLFIGLSKFVNEKIKIEKTSKAYYIIGLCFLQLTLVGIGWFGIFSEWFSYTGGGQNLVYFLTFLLLSGLLYLINYKFKDLECKYVAAFVGIISIYHFLVFIGLSIEMIMVVIATCLLLINILLKDHEFIISVSHVVSYLYFPILLGIDGLENIILVAIIITVINMIYLIFEKEDQFEKKLAVIITYFLGIDVVSRIGLWDTNIMIFIGLTVFYIILNYQKTSFIKQVNQVMYNIVVTFLLLMLDSSLKIFICSLIYGLVNFINCYITNRENSRFDLYYQPIVVFIVFFGIFNILEDVININIIYYFIGPTVLYAIINYMIKDEKIKKIYYIYLLIGIILTLIINMVVNNIISGILLMILAVYLYYISNKYSIWAYVFVLITMLLLKNVIYENISYGIILNMFNILLFGGLTYIYKENIKLRKINLIFIMIPLYSLITLITMNNEVKTILFNLFNLYLLFIIVTQFIDNIKTKDVVATIFTILILFNLIFVNSLLIGLYIGLVGIVLIIITYNRIGYKALFHCGVVITIVNIIIKLGDFWTRIPLGVYLLVAGGGIIAFVTNKEIKMQHVERVIKEDSEQQNINMLNNENVSHYKVMNFCAKCGNKNDNYKFCPKCGNSMIIKE